MDLIHKLLFLLIAVLEQLACQFLFAKKGREKDSMVSIDLVVSCILTIATRQIAHIFFAKVMSIDPQIGSKADIVFVILNLLLTLAVGFLCHRRTIKRKKSTVPVSVNFHFTRKCNLKCGFCFHTDTSSHLESFDNIKRGLTMLKKAGMRKINFAGGEPFLHVVLLRRMLRFCKEELALESVSIVTNGSKLTETFLYMNSKHIDIIAVSVDSFDERTNVQIGRGAGNHLQNVQKVAKLCRKYQVKFKVNTVVNRYNLAENMNAQIRALQPFRWKVFQVLIVEGENDSAVTKRDARRFCISDEEFQEFCARHQDNECFIPESNQVMKSSYLILDEYMRFLNKGTGAPTESILHVGAANALKNVQWDQKSFRERGGIYDWTNAPEGPCASPQLEF